MPPDPESNPASWAGFSLKSPLVMGILNVTPDSFSGDGVLADPQAAIAVGAAMVADGADIVDIGGESTRPGARGIDPREEIDRILPVVRGLAAAGVVVSVDTSNAVTMAAALDAGAQIINDVSALRRDRDAAALIATRGCPVVLMHMRGTPQTMGCHAHYGDVVSEVMAELAARRDAACEAGIDPARIVLDPGLGFAKTGVQNFAILRALDRFRGLGQPLLVGASRKRFIGAAARQPDPRRRDAGSIAAALFAACHGAAILRVHDVAGTVQALRVWRVLELG